MSDNAYTYGLNCVLIQKAVHGEKDALEETDMNLMPDLFSFAYVSGWYEQLNELAELAIWDP